MQNISRLCILGLLIVQLIIQLLTGGVHCANPPLFRITTNDIHVEIGTNVLPLVKARLLELLPQVTGVIRVTDTKFRYLYTNQATPATLAATSMVLAFGNSTTANELIPASELSALGSEAFIVRSKMDQDGRIIFAANGNPGNDPLVADLDINIGAAFACYALLEEIGFAFYHPLRPTVPKQLQFRPVKTDNLLLNIRSTPYWPIRGFHIHTMHPLEVTELLNGFPVNRTEWESLLWQWDRVLEWMLANRQNRIEWVLLNDVSFKDFAESEERVHRLRYIADRSLQWAIVPGADVPFALKQQHAWCMIRKMGTLEEDYKQLHKSIDLFIDSINFRFISSEIGFSEFTAPDDKLMLAWMDEATRYLGDKYNDSRKIYIKVHCTQGAFAKHYTDPVTGKPLNYNFLPYYADKRLGVYPHTVQFYSLTDPAPTYGNSNFTYIFDYMMLEAGKREVIWFPETAYWINYDIDIPLFLPLYADRRIADMRMIAREERAKNKRIQGQFNFDSGWEWSYWLNDVITARIAWDPLIDLPTHEDAMSAMLDVIVRPFDDPIGSRLRQSLFDLIVDQRNLLIFGTNSSSSRPTDVVKRNGIAYLAGWDTWAEVSLLADMITNKNMLTQPKRVSIGEVRFGIDRPSYTREIRPMMIEMEKRFSNSSDYLTQLFEKQQQQQSVSETALELFSDIVDSAQMLALRAKFMRSIYDYAHDHKVFPNQQKIDELKDIIYTAMSVVKHREDNYRVPSDQIAGWRKNPTAYPYAYLWPVRSLFFWWRDFGLAVHHPISPCYMNVISPFNIVLGEGVLYNIGDLLRNLFEHFKFADWLTDCLGEPDHEPEIPPRK